MKIVLKCSYPPKFYKINLYNMILIINKLNKYKINLKIYGY